MYFPPLNATSIDGIPVDPSAKADGKALTYSATASKIVFSTVTSTSGLSYVGHWNSATQYGLNNVVIDSNNASYVYVSNTPSSGYGNEPINADPGIWQELGSFSAVSATLDGPIFTEGNYIDMGEGYISDITALSFPGDFSLQNSGTNVMTVVSGGYSPSSVFSFLGNALNMNTGSGTGGGTLSMDGGPIVLGSNGYAGTVVQSSTNGVTLIDSSGYHFDFSDGGHATINGGTGWNGGNANLSISTTSGIAADFNGEVDIGGDGTYNDPSPGYAYDLKCGGGTGGMTCLGSINSNGGFLVNNNSVISPSGQFTGSVSATDIRSSSTISAGSTISTSNGTISGKYLTASSSVTTGYFSTNITTVSNITSYFVTVLNGSTILVNNTSAGTVNLPPATSYNGRECTVKSIGTGVVTVSTNSVGTIDGSSTYSLTARYKYVTVQSDGANWWIIGNN